MAWTVASGDSERRAEDGNGGEGGSIARTTRRGRFHLTNRRIIGLLFNRWRVANIPLTAVRHWESAEAMGGKGSYWIASRPLLLLQVEDTGGSMTTVGLAVNDADDWVRQLNELVPTTD